MAVCSKHNPYLQMRFTCNRNPDYDIRNITIGLNKLKPFWRKILWSTPQISYANYLDQRFSLNRFRPIFRDKGERKEYYV